VRVSDTSVLAQVNSTKRIPTVQEAIEKRGLQVHGWVYDVATGLLKDVPTKSDPDKAAYQVVSTSESLE